MSTEQSKVDNIFERLTIHCLPSYHLTFVLVYQQPTIVWHESTDKQCLIKETHINEHLHHVEILVLQVESDMTRHLYHAEQLIRHVELYTKVTRPVARTMQRL